MYEGRVMTHHMPEPTGTLLGQETNYDNKYDKSLLQPIPRSLGRDAIGASEFIGSDYWHIYEATWRTPYGLPATAVGRMIVPAESPFIVESKSLKLYVGSFTEEVFSSKEEAASVMSRDLSEVLQAPVCVEFFDVASCPLQPAPLEGVVLEEEYRGGGRFDSSDVDPDLLALDPSGESVEEILSTNLFRSLCPVTRQPDHASITIAYKGRKWDRAALLSYLVSFRHHRGFHEQCVETIFTEASSRLKPESLVVTARFTRRGGIDICPTRASSVDLVKPPARLVRQ